jgi:glycosyltransferase involved in cell wall biosynthesis
MISGDRSVPSGKHGAFHATLEEFSKHWDRIDVLCPHVPHPRPSPFENVFFHPSPHGLARQPAWITRTGITLIGDHQHDVATVHEFPPFYNGIGAARLHQRTGIPYVLEIHHVVGYPRAASASERIGAVLSRMYLARDARLAAAVRVVNGEVGDILRRFGIPQEKIHIVPSFYLDSLVFHPSVSTEKRFDVVFCARLVKNKGLLTLLEALKHLPYSLLVIGDGPERARAEAFVARHGMSDRVSFVGWLPTREDVAEQLRSARVCVMNSTSEGGPRSALEAMACGLPIITTRVGVMPDVVRDGENGCFTDGSSAELKKHLHALLDDPDRWKRMGQEAAKIAERFDRHALIRQYAQFLQSFAGRR